MAMRFKAADYNSLRRRDGLGYRPVGMGEPRRPATIGLACAIGEQDLNVNG